MRIAYIAHRFPHLTETFIVREMVELQRLGFSIDVFSLMKPKTDAASEDAGPLVERSYHSSILSLPVLAAQAAFLRRSPWKYAKAVITTIRLTWREPRVMALVLALFPKGVYYARIMQQLDVDHIQAHFVWIEAVIADVIRELTGIPYTVRPHAFGLFGRNHNSVRLQLERADGVITISQYHRDFIESMSRSLAESTIEVVHCGVDVDHWGPRTKRGESERFRILSVGRPVPKKGHEVLIDACALLAQRGRSFSCQIVAGQGRLADALEKRIQELGLGESVEIVSYMDEQSLRALFDEADAFALASVVAPSGDRDGIPIVLMEAMSMEVPVVSTDVAGIPELIVDGKTGLLVSQSDPPGLAEAIERLMNDDDLGDRLAKAGRAHVMEHFSATGVAQELAETLRRSRPGNQRTP